MLLCPLPRGRYSRLLILLPRLRHIIRQRIVRVGSSQERLDGEKDRPNLERGGPVA